MEQHKHSFGPVCLYLVHLSLILTLVAFRGKNCLFSKMLSYVYHLAANLIVALQMIVFVE